MLTQLVICPIKGFLTYLLQHSPGMGLEMKVQAASVFLLMPKAWF
jgi:hypothetical protein